MKRTVIVLLVLSVLSSLSFGITLVQKSDTTPEFILSGLIWDRYTVEYLPDRVVTNQMAIKRNYISMKLNARDYSSNLTLDIVNLSKAQTGGDFVTWLKLAYVDLIKLPLLSDAGIKVRAGIQPVYFGSSPSWKYNIYEAPVDDRIQMPSADMGVALLGEALDKMISYELTVYSGDGYKTLDTDLLKALCANVKVTPLPGLDVLASYYKKNGITHASTEKTDFSAFAVTLKYALGPLMDSYVEVIEVGGARVAGVSSGIKQIISAYAGYKVLDWLSVHARMDILNPDTKVKNDEMNYYYAGVLIPLADKVSLLLDYSLNQKRVQGANDKNDNLYVAQIKWEW